MRSTFFVMTSILVHALCVAAIALSPQKIEAPKDEIEVQVGEASASATPNEPASPSAQPPLSAQLKPISPQPARAKRAATAPVEPSTPDESTEAAAPATPAAVDEEVPVELDPEIGEEPVGAAVTETPSENTTAAGGVKAGETKEGAVSYLDLKQTKGNKPPVYPFRARREARQGQVELIYRVTRDGRVTDVQIAKSSGHPDLDNEAVRAVKQFRFAPGQEGWASHPISFALKGEAEAAPSRLRSAQTE